MRQRTIALILGLLAVLVVASPASAGRTWCMRDPVFKINGQVVDVRVGSTQEMAAKATGPIQLVLTVPMGVQAELLAKDHGFGYGWDIQIVHSSNLKASASGIQVMAQVYAPATDSLPVRVVIQPRSSTLVGPADVEGTANGWVTAKPR